MKIKTETILMVLKYLALLAGIGFSIECGSQIFYFVASFINPDWAKNGYQFEQEWYQIHQFSAWYYVCVLTLAISVSGSKALIWYLIFGLLQKLQLKSPFSMVVTKKLETFSYLLLGIWILMGLIGKTYAQYLGPTGITLPDKYTGDEYFFMAGMVYIISQIFKRGVEMQEENQLTV
jgi:hypothetical protein